MPVEAGTSEFTYLGDGVTKAFPFPSRFFTNDDLSVGLNNVEQSSSTYTVTGAGSAVGGSVTFTVAPAAGAEVLLLRRPEASQLVDFVNGQTILEGTLDNALDRLTMLIQYLLRRDTGVIRASEFDTQVSMQLPTVPNRASKLLGFGSSGEPIALNPSPAENGFSTIDAIIDATPIGKAVVRAANQAEARAAIGSMTEENIANGAITLAKLATALLNGTTGALVQWATGPKYPAGDGSNITNLTGGNIVGGIAAALLSGTISAARMPSGTVIGSVSATVTADTALTATIPYDDTPPLSSEGTQVASVTLNVQNASSNIEVDVSFSFGTSANNLVSAIWAIFDGTTNVDAGARRVSDYGTMWHISRKITFAAGAAGAHTISLRIGPASDAAGTIYLNSKVNGARYFGGTSKTTLTAKEVTP